MQAGMPGVPGLQAAVARSPAERRREGRSLIGAVLWQNRRWGENSMERVAESRQWRGAVHVCSCPYSETAMQTREDTDALF